MPQSVGLYIILYINQWYIALHLKYGRLNYKSLIIWSIILSFAGLFLGLKAETERADSKANIETHVWKCAVGCALMQANNASLREGVENPTFYGHVRKGGRVNHRK